MPATLPILTLSAIAKSIDRGAIRSAVRQAFLNHARGKTVVPPPMHLQFAEPPGDGHVKAGYVTGSPYFVVKVATGFYENHLRGLPSNDGLMLVFSATTGAPVAVLQDEGWLTSWRTAAAGAVAAELLAPERVDAVGVIGTGHQALLQLDWLRDVVACRRAVVWGRNAERCHQLVPKLESLGYQATVAPDVRSLFDSARLVVTTTASTSAQVMARDVHEGTHITAMGSDLPGKQELDPEILAKAAVIAVDDVGQCVHHGELGVAVRRGLVVAERAVSLGDLIDGRFPGRAREDDITVADLTGLGAQDHAIASLVVSQLL